MRIVGKAGIAGMALSALFLGSCARAGARPAASPAAQAEGRPPRIPDSAPEKIAAQRAASGPQLQLEAEDDRWGIEAAQERKRLEEQQQATPVRTPNASGSIGVSPAPAAPKPPAATPRP